VTAIAGLLATGQVTEAVAEEPRPAQLSVASALTVVSNEQISVGTAPSNEKFTEAPGARDGAVKTGTLGALVFTTTMFVTVTLPLFATVPEYLAVPPGVKLPLGQRRVTSS
jgi:hypothetical protein